MLVRCDASRLNASDQPIVARTEVLYTVMPVVRVNNIGGSSARSKPRRGGL